mmetsp:Transcript_15749/g.25518  ORF Transcript_15749/g.25518 Transcript_15749/m.25518 type:complete len:239 (+) Transcript_15749:1-717(+)
MAHIERRLEKTNLSAEERNALEQVAKGLEEGIPARSVGVTKDDEFAIKSMGLLTLKPIMYAFNVDEVDWILGRDEIQEKCKAFLEKSEYHDPNDDSWTIVSAKVEAELSLLSSDEKVEYLSSLGIEDAEKANEYFSYNILPSMAEKLLGLAKVYTGPGVPPERSRTTRAHLFSKLTAEGLAGRIHGDIEKGFIRAEVINAAKLLELPNYVAAKETGSLRIEGRDYKLVPDDVVLIRWR